MKVIIFILFININSNSLPLTTMSVSLFEAIKASDNILAKTLSQHINEPINNITDGDNNTVLHLAANSSNFQMTEHFLMMYDSLITSQPQKFTIESKKKWINQKDNNGFTSLHYAVFRGNYKIAFLLEQHGADIYAINSQGLNVLHIAAQGDSPCLLVFIDHKQGFKIGVKDFKGSTPLHWACYSAQQNSVNALIAWMAELDVQDFTYGFTPLHLAVMSGNGRIVKKLLLRGCDRNVKDFSGKLPLDLAKQNQYTNIQTMLIDKQGIAELLNIKSPYRKVGKFSCHFFFLIFAFLLNYGLNIVFVVRESFKANQIMAIIYLVMGFFVAVMFVIAKTLDPGYIQPHQDKNFFQLLIRHHPNKICYDCQIVKPKRSRHCQICQACVCVFDHHCPWISNCIGANNYIVFYTFLVSMQVFMIYTIAFEIVNCTVNDWSAHTALDFFRSLSIVLALVLSCIFLIPLSFLYVVQTQNCFSDQTSFQRYGGKKQTRRQTYLREMNSSSLRSSLMQRGSQSRKSVNDSLKQSQNSQMNQQNTPKTSIRIQLQEKISVPRKLLINSYNMCLGNRQNKFYQMHP